MKQKSIFETTDFSASKPTHTKTLTINIIGEGSGTVDVVGETFSTDSPEETPTDSSASENNQTQYTYTAAANTPLTISVSADEGSYIDSISDNNILSWTTTDRLAVANITMPGNDVTLDVKFGKYYTVTLNRAITNGNVGISPSSGYVKAGDTIELYPTPHDGYELTSLSYITDDAPSTEVPIDLESETYSFKMPAANVIIKATFNRIESYPHADAEHVQDYTEFTGKYAYCGKERSRAKVQLSSQK